MSEILLCSRPVQADQLSQVCDVDGHIFEGRACTLAKQLAAYTPYVVGKPSPFDQQLTSMFSVPSVAKELTHLSLSFGDDNTLALAELTKKIHEYNIGLVGASTSVYAGRMGGFVGAVKEYQDALMAYREVLKSNPSAKVTAKQRAMRAFEKLQVQFRQEMSSINAAVKSRRGTPLSNPTRALNIARSSRSVAKLNVTSQAQAHNLVRFTQHAKCLGNGLAVIDFTGRVANVSQEYRAGGEWERELFIESSSFAASAIVGSYAVKAGLGLLLMATPVGWVGLIAGGVAVAGAAAGASILVNNAIKENSGGWYDSIMKAMGVQ